MRTEARIDALVALAKEAVVGLQCKQPAASKKVGDATWGPMSVYGTFYPIEDGMPAEVPRTGASVLVMPLRGKTEADGRESLRVKLMILVYEPGDRVNMPEDGAIRAIDLRDDGAGWRGMMRVIDRLRGAFAGRMRVPGSDMTVEGLEWSVYTADGLIPDLRPYYCGWMDVDLACGDELARNEAVAELLS